MENNFTRLSFEKIFNVEKIITLFYMEFSKSFRYDGERHDFWEIVYIDKGEMLCTADKKRFVLKSGEMTFHKPNEFHNLSGDNNVAPNVSIITFECKSRAMKFFEGKIFQLNSREKALLSEIFSEGMSCYRLVDEKNPLLQKMEKRENAPYGSSQAVKNLLELFLITLSRNTEALSKSSRQSYVINGVDVPYNVKEIIDYMKENIYGNLSVSDIAVAVNKSESTLKQLFSRHIDGGIINYYGKLKMNEAKKLLKEGRYNIAQISDMLCYDNPQYFSKCFKRITKMTPTEYKDSIIK